jgi:F0F1-type ATP synthase assembly protein I
MKYSSMATQMIVIIGGASWGGFKLDNYWHTLPVFTVILSLSGVGLAIYFSIKDFIN